MFRTLGTSVLLRSWAAAAALATLYVLGGLALDRGGGLIRTVVTTTHRQDQTQQRETAVSRGVWEVPETGLYDLSLDGRGRVTWTIDEIPVINRDSAGAGVATRTIWLTLGFHRVEIRQPLDPSNPPAAIAAARAGRAPQPLVLKAAAPRNPGPRLLLRMLRGIVGWFAIAAVILAIAVSVLTLRNKWNGEVLHIAVPAWTRRAILWATLGVILLHAALLRIDAITERYGPVSSPRWIAAVQTRTVAPPRSLRPASIALPPEGMYPHADGKETHYVSDPYTYLEAARTMSSFYAAHFREPVFPFATRSFLHLLGDEDVAVSFASAFFSTVAVWLTYLLGAALWSRPAGLLAALGLSLDSDVIARASLGWRDDAYMAMVTLCAYLMLRWWRAGQAEPRNMYMQAVLFGVGAGFAILTRIMAVSFLAAGVAWLVVTRYVAWRRHLRAAGFALATSVLIAAPYFVNCWRVYGDPFYTFNVHGHIYSVAERHEKWEGSTAGYVAQKIEQRPFEMLDTVAQGLTTYPFTNKWKGLDAWIPGLGWWASVASIAGLIVLAASAEGRLLLVLMVSSLVPFSFTWTVDPDFRFTEHVYPILLIAAAVAVTAAFAAGRVALVSNRGAGGRAWPRVSWLPWASTVGLVLAVLWFTEHVSPSLVFAETLQKREDATITAGSRDGASFQRGWSEVVRGENVSMRVVVEEGTLLVRLPSQADYPVTLRMDPFPRPLVDAPDRLPVVVVALNNIDVGEIQLRWTPGRVGAYDILLPRAAARRGVNRLVLRVKRPAASPIRPGLTDGDAVGLWYVRVHPPA
jgi:4-amino-4-deoxy-L-arabinose transferase-like glycosyltransferase